MTEIFKFIDVSDAEIDARKRYNQSPEKYQIPTEYRDALRQIYIDDIRLLESVLKRDLSFWLE